jgi:hypothetical protein
MEYSKSLEAKDLDVKWKKTKLVAFASCIKPKRQDTGSDMGEQRDGSVGSNAQESDLEGVNGCLDIISNKADLEDDDVFIWDQQRRASEPVVLKRNGNASMFRSGRQRQNKLRTLREDVTVSGNRPQPSKLARSASSSGTRTALSQFFTFSPTVVRKINLSASLRDWLESERQSRNKTRKTGAKNIGSTDECLHQNVEKSNGEECYPYRRRSADTVGKKLNIDEGRRPSAPPALSGKENENCKQKSVQAKPHIPLCYNGDNKFDSVHEFQIHTLINEELKSKLESVCFCAQSCRKRCEEISEFIKERIQDLLSTPCKVVCTVYIGALRDYGIHTASQATLNYKLDYHVSACYQNESLFAAVSVLVVRYGAR